VGRWVRGDDHYDRLSLIEYLLNAQDTAIWVVGTRRMGKTSLLRQLELITNEANCHYVPLFWDLQGCTSSAALSNELALALEDDIARFAPYDIDIESFRQEDAIHILRRLSRALGRHDRQLLLLIDEAEVLIDIAQREASWLARLRKTLQEGHQRTIITSTKLLTQLTHQSTDWMTSPFLFGFHLVNLWPLPRDGAIDLIRHIQAGAPVNVDDTLVEEILHHTNRHPYFIQCLCQRLYVADDNGGYLRPIEDGDLALDPMLSSFFTIDFQRLSEQERRILLAIASADGPLKHEELIAALGEEQAAHMTTPLADLKELGHVRQLGGDWAIGSVFLERWLHANAPRLRAELGDATPGGEAPDRLDEQNIQAVARSLGVSADRIKALADMQIASAADLFNTVRHFFHEIRHIVEQDDGHKLLITTSADGVTSLRSEEEVQVALKHWLRPMCRALNIHMDREPLTGRGFLDFKFSVGHDFRCLVEVKLFDSPKLQDGVNIQLPIYLVADKAYFGIYVPIFLDAPGHETVLKELRRLAARRARSHRVKIDVIDMRAWRPLPASKAGELEEPERYRFTP
jgi:hypothetical protein